MRLDAGVLLGMINDEKMSIAHPAVHTYELPASQHDPAAKRHSFSNISEPTGAIELPGSNVDPPPGIYYNPPPGNYLAPQSGVYMSSAGKMRPHSMTSLPNQLPATDSPQTTDMFR